MEKSVKKAAEPLRSLVSSDRGGPGEESVRVAPGLVLDLRGVELKVALAQD